MVSRCFYFQGHDSERLLKAFLEREIYCWMVKQELIGKNDAIDYNNLTYGDIFSTIKKLGINMCNDQKMLKQQLKK